MKCFKCEEQMDNILFPAVENPPMPAKDGVVLLSENGLMEGATLHACTSRDCQNVGIVMVIPDTTK